MSYEIAAAGLGTVGNLMGMGMQNQTTQDMMNQQTQNQMFLNNQMQDIQQQNWDYTNFENQRKHLENAGLNAGLLYGMSGGGGSTMGGASGGSAAGGQAAHAPNFMEVAQQMLQAKAIESQTKVNDATANKENALANKIAGVDTKETEAKIPTYAKGMEFTDAQIKQIASAMNKNEAEVKSIFQGIKESEQRIIESEGRIKLNEAETNRINSLTPWEVQKLQTEVERGLIQNKYLDERERKELNLISKQAWNYVVTAAQKNEEISIQDFKTQFEANHPGVLNVMGEAADQVIRGILKYINPNNTLSIKRK